MIRAFLLLFCVAMAGCVATVTQQRVQSAAPSYDEGAQTSGILARLVDSTVSPARVSFVVTDHFRDRYNSLIAVYGSVKTSDKSPLFTPALKKDDDLVAVPADDAKSLYHVDSAWHLGARGMANMVVLSGLKRRGFQP